MAYYWDTLGEFFYSNYNAFPTYPLTTPDNIVVLQELKYPGADSDAYHYYGGRIYLQYQSGYMNAVYPVDCVDSMYPPLHPNGEPYEFSEAHITESSYRLYPRWTESTPYDWWNTTDASVSYPYASPFNPKSQNAIFNQMFYSSGCFSFKKTAANGMSTVYELPSYDLVEVPFNPTNSTFNYTCKLGLMVDSRLCCFNKGATISGKIVYKKVSATLYPSAVFSNYGGFSISWGSPEPHSEADWSVTFDETNSITAPYKIQDIDIPQEDGYAVFVDDFYITSVTKP